MTPWLDCAHCRSLPDGGAGNRPTTLSLIHQPVEDLSNSRRAHGTARVPGCLRPPHERLTQPTTGPLLVPSTRSRPARSRLHPRQVPFQRHHHSVRWIRAKRTLLCRWIESVGADDNYDYIIFDCPPATKIVSQNALAASHGYIIPVVPDLLMQLGVAHLIGMIRDGIDRRLNELPHDPPTAMWVPKTAHAGIVVTRIKTAGRSPYTMNHTDGLQDLNDSWQSLMIDPLIEDGTGVAQATRLNVPVFDRRNDPNITNRGFVTMFTQLVANVKGRIDAI